MKRTALSLMIATIASVALSPASFASPDFDQLRRENLDRDAISLDQLRDANREKSDKLDQLRRENLDKDAVDFDRLRRENLETN